MRKCCNTASKVAESVSTSITRAQRLSCANVYVKYSVKQVNATNPLQFVSVRNCLGNIMTDN